MVAKHRSPNYPRVNLETAIDLLRKLYNKVRKGEFTAIDAAGAWGYNSASGPVRAHLAALRQYGLLEGKKGRNAENPRISRRGLAFVLRNRASREYKSELKEAALAPPLFEEIYSTLSDAADGALREHLIAEMGFTDSGAQRYVEVYRDTIQLANLNKDDAISGLEDGDPMEDEEAETNDSISVFTTVGRQTSMVTIPLSTEGEYAVLLSQMTPAEWDRKVKLFEAYKDTLVQDEPESIDST